MIEQNYAKKILLVEDQEKFYTPVMRWLQEEGYQITLANSYLEASTLLDTDHFHLAIVDIRLVEEDKQNKQGLQLSADIQQMQLKDVMPCILLTAHATKENVIAAWLEHGVSKLVEKKPGYRKRLLETVRELFDQEVKINFDLVYDAGADRLLVDIADDVNWSMASKPQLALLTQQIRDLVGKLFSGAKRVFIIKMKPGLTGAAVVRVQPTWEQGLGRSYVAKVGRRDKMEIERDHYKRYVANYLPANTVTQIEGAYTRHVGMLKYTFAEDDTGPLKEFDEFYQRNQPEAIITSLRNLFQNTCRYWYDNVERRIEDLPQLYYSSFQLDEQKLVNRIQIVLPQFTSQAETFRFDQNLLEVLNPITWLARYRSECVLPIYHCITHGDLTGRNIMVSEHGRCWLIDFYRTYPSHILRDFVILESNIKYRLLSTPAWKDFLKLEEMLLKIDQTTNFWENSSDLPRELQKAGQIIAALRTIALEFSRGRGPNRAESTKEYLISLLMTTLNVVRLRHIPEERKLQAMLSAALICAKLDKLAGREPIRLNFDNGLALPELDQPLPLIENSVIVPLIKHKPTAQHNLLAEYLRDGNLVLFIGSGKSTSSDWPTLEKLAQQLMIEIDYKPVPGDSPRKLFDIYSDKINRGYLVRKMVEYYKEDLLLPFFEQVATFKWSAIYTTNQHTYLEGIFEKLGLPYKEIVSPPQRLEDLRNSTPIYKLYGSLNKDHRHDPTTLPISDTEYRQPEIRTRLKQFLGKLEQDLNEGKLLVMLYATEQEIKQIQEYYQPSPNTGLIWLVSSQFSEEEQDFYRKQGLRVVPNDPSDLLSLFSVLINK